MKRKKINLEGSPTMTVLEDFKNESLDKLIEVYKQDKRKAKILFKNNTNGGYSKTKICLFEYPNNDFRIVSLTRTHGFSINGNIYSREKNNWAVIYKHKTKSFYLSNQNNSIRQLSLNLLIGYINSSHTEKVVKYFFNRFGWLRNVSESEYGKTLSFSTIVRHKLYNEKEILKYVFKCPYPVAKMLATEVKTSYSPHDFVKVWIEAKKVLINIENLKQEMVMSQYFFDTTKMASTLGKKVNCSWGLKRLKQEHDNFNKEIIDVVLEFEPLKYLRISKVYLDFAEFAKPHGVKLLKTNHELIEEGKRMKHCVGTYSGNVDNGNSAIYRFMGYTLELQYHRPWNQPDTSKKLIINQYKAQMNAEPPQRYRQMLQSMVDAFNETIKDKEYLEIGNRALNSGWDLPNPVGIVIDELPF